MADFKLTIGDSKTKRTFKADLKSPDADQLVGKKIRENFRGELIGLTGFEFQITGGSDSAGFPMKSDIEGLGRRRLLLSDGFGFKARKEGQRKRRSIRGNTISNETVQINCKIIKWGEEDLMKHFNIQPKEEKKPASSEPVPA
jgi:small subunit ribosomal protein S6e